MQYIYLKFSLQKNHKIDFNSIAGGKLNHILMYTCMVKIQILVKTDSTLDIN